jgi:acyl-CoA thioester hydrolase
MSAKFSIPVRVYYEDTDTAGVVYYANYLKFMERARTEWLRSLGIEQSKLSAQGVVVFAVRSANVDFLGPARLDDELRVTIAIRRVGRVSITFDQTVEREATVLCRGEVKVACLDAQTFQPAALPEHIFRTLDTGSVA